ncbi:hypothetical protein [Microbacterium sp. CJ88]|uniref:hypothetical protein n=1 Tax=Microbacterium sp. CJ88 TaxID=3445672 RepID=UPI003F6593D1
MNSFTSKTSKLIAGTTLSAALLGGALVAGPAQAAEPAPAPPTTNAVDVGVGVDLDPIAIIGAIKDAVNNQADRAGAVQAALDVGYYSASNPDRLTVAVVNKDQDIQVSGEVADAQTIAIKDGN